MCLYPKLIKNRKYISNKKNRGIIPPLPLIKVNGKLIPDERVLYVPVPCGKCMECMKKKARDWQIRLQEDIKQNKNGVFITLTLSNDSYKKLYNNTNKKLKGYELDNLIIKNAVRKFLERHRKKHKKSIRHWLVSELGHNGTENIHLHGILWTERKPEELEKLWGYGYIWDSRKHNGYVNEKTVNYIIKYIHKQDQKHKYYKPIILTTPGIGSNYVKSFNSKRNKFNNEKTITTYKNKQGYEIALPTYYRNKIYNEEEREKIWIYTLDKEVRYILGEKIDVSSNENSYYKTLKYYRQMNDKLGYLNDRINWEKRRYENERRYINHIKRLKNKFKK